MQVFDDLLTLRFAPSFSAKQKKRIFRRRPKEFRDRWKVLYERGRIHKSKLVYKRAYKLIRKESLFLFNTPKKSRTFSGEAYTFPKNNT